MEHAGISPALASEVIASTLSGGQMPDYPMVGGNRVTVLRDNAEFAPALLDDLEAASQTANQSVYNWEDDGVGMTYKLALRRKASSGASNALEGISLTDWAGARALSIRGAGFKGVQQELVENANVLSKINYPWSRGGAFSNHSKLYAFDGAVGYTGLNLGLKYDAWRELGLRVEGPAAAFINAEILSRHVQMGGTVSEVQRRVLEESLRAPVDAGTAGARLVMNTPGRRNLTHAWNSLVANASERIWVGTSFLTSPGAADKLAEAAQSVPDVRVFVQTAGNKNRWLNLMSQMHYADLIESGVKVVELDPSHFYHAKALLADSQALIHSSPLSVMSFRFADEAGVLTDDLAAVGKLAEGMLFHAQGSRVLTRADITPKLTVLKWVGKILGIRY